MQFHLNGFRTGDPELQPETPEPAKAAPAKSGGATPGHATPGPETKNSLPERVDVLIVGCGPAGLTLAAQLSAFPDITTRIVDLKPQRLQLGQADGIACRTMEMFQAFGFSERVLREGYWVNEATFWKPDEHNVENIVRTGRVQDTEEGLSEFPHMILNQARVHDFYLDVMLKSPARLVPDYSRQLIELDVDPQIQASSGYPVTATLQRVESGSPNSGCLNSDSEGQVETVRARYVVGCDGARSSVRKCIGRSLHGESANNAWGVMDVLAVTDFPDIRKKSLIQSAKEGSIVIIPREGGYLARLYIEMDKLNKDERVANRQLTSDDLVAAARRILHPYTLEVKEIPWWSVYEIGQRLCDKFDDLPVGNLEGGMEGNALDNTGSSSVQGSTNSRCPHVFIAGDACHTHSPKAGQGMNVSMQDTFNLGWKLAAVLQGRSPPELLHTYSAERQSVARELIDFDREWASIMSARSSHSAQSQDKGQAPQFQSYFIKSGRYTAGTAIKYQRSSLCAEPVHQHLAKGFPIGMRFHSAPVVRLADARPMQLGHIMKADGRWRLFAFAGREDSAGDSSALRSLTDFLLDDPSSPVTRYTPAGADIDSVIDVRAVFAQSHHELNIDAMPSLLLPEKGRLALLDYEKAFCADQGKGQDIYQMRGIDREQGCMIVVRPDQFVAQILPLDAFESLADFLAGFMTASS